MEVYVARQPIFDRDMNVFGYELLYRKSMNNYYEGSSDTQATAELIHNAFLALPFQELTEGRRGFINFSEQMLFEEIPLLLPKDLIVVEILERVESTDKLRDTCKKLKEKGYLLALDDFVFQESFVPIIEQTELIKIEFPLLPLNEQRALIKRYGKTHKFLAEKVETRQEYLVAREMGYEYFQGYFFGKPVIVSGKDLPSVNGNLIRVISELNRESPNFQKITEIIETDVGLSYKLLRMANSVFFGARQKIHSIKNALVHLGMDEIRKWIYLMMLKDIQRIENKELIKTCLLRAKIMEFMALKINRSKHLEYFMAGLFSGIDILLNRKMDTIVDELALTEEVKEALLGKPNPIRDGLDLVKYFEGASWDQFEEKQTSVGLEKSQFMKMYLEALKWVGKMEYE